MPSRMRYSVRLSIEFARILVASLVAAVSLCAAGDERPNFVVILADDLGYGDLGSYGGKAIRTPRIDRMAEEGVRLTEFYSAASICTPARAALLTGRYPYRTGLTRVLVPKERWGLPAEETTMAEALRELGYRTACVGKWHLGGRKPFRPEKHGFDEFYGVLYSNDMTLLPLLKWPRFQLLDGSNVEQSPAKQGELTRLYTERALRFIGESKNHPFFLYLSHTMPHAPVSVSPRFRDRSASGPYADAVEELDWSVGEILDGLREQGLAERTLVVFTSDNGPWIKGARKAKPQGGSSAPLRGGKGTSWEGGFRVPMIALWASALPAGETRDGVATMMDLFPTLLALAGGALAEEVDVDGVDITAFLKGQAGAPQSPLFYYLEGDIAAVREGRWKAHYFRRGLAPNGKLQQSKRLSQPELYDLDIDLSESIDLAEAHPEIVSRLAALGESFHASIKPTMVLPSPKNGVVSGIMRGAPRSREEQTEE